MKDFRAQAMEHIAQRNAQVAASAEVAKPAAPPPPSPKPTRKQRRANAAMSRQINSTIKKANELGRPISLRTDGRGQLRAVMGKAKKPDPGPQPGEVIKSVDGNVMPDFPSTEPYPESPEIVVDAAMQAELDRIANMDPFEAADELVKETLAMSRDLFIYWAPEHKPSVEGVGHELEDYFVRFSARVWKHSNGPRWMVDLPGVPEAREGQAPEVRSSARWIEVYVAEDNIDVITRDQDDLTNAIAVGFAERCARKWKGRLEK